MVAKMLRPEGERDANIDREVARDDLINEIWSRPPPCSSLLLSPSLAPSSRLSLRARLP